MGSCKLGRNKSTGHSTTGKGALAGGLIQYRTARQSSICLDEFAHVQFNYFPSTSYSPRIQESFRPWKPLLHNNRFTCRKTQEIGKDTVWNKQVFVLLKRLPCNPVATKWFITEDERVIVKTSDQAFQMQDIRHVYRKDGSGGKR